MSDPPTFYTMPISHYCVSVDRMLAFKGIRPRVVRVPYHDKRELIRDTGQDYVPALRWDGTTVSWRQIPEFLEARQPTPRLYPEGQEGLARVLESWGHDVLEERVWRAVVTHVPGTMSDEHERWVFEEMQTRARGPWHVLELREKEFESDALSVFGTVESMLAGRSWVLGEPSVADFGLFGGLSPWLTIGRTIPKEFPNLARWVDRIRALGGPNPR